MTTTSVMHETLKADPVSREEMDRLVAVQRKAFLAEGIPSAEVRTSRIDRLMLAILENADDLAEALDADYGIRPSSVTKAFDEIGLVPEAQTLRENLAEWMKPVAVTGGFVQHKPLGVVGVVGAWNFPLALTLAPALDALAAGNRVILKFPDLHVRTGRVLAKAVAARLSEDEVAVVLGDVKTASDFSELALDHIVFTGSPSIGKLVAAAAGRNLVPVTLELGGKNPTVVARDADLTLAAHRIAGTRALNGGQICLCPDYVFVPREVHDEFVAKLVNEFRALFPEFLDNPGVVSVVNDRNYDRIVGLIDDAVAQGATKIQVAADREADALPSRDTRRIPPTVLLNVPDSATIASEEIFGPVLVVYRYDDVQEVIDYVSSRPSPLAAYWYGSDGPEFQRFLEYTTSGGVSRNDGLIQSMALDAPFGGIGNSGTGAYHGKAGFDRLTHQRSVIAADGPNGVSDGFIGRVLVSDELESGLDQSIAAAIADIKTRVA